jgi:uncharacterized protein (TIGR02453 family)
VSYGREVAFKGWPPEAIEFLEGLSFDNSKSYWTAHKETYELCVRGPMEGLLNELEAQFGPGRIFRPYRDVRFSKDKSPYKTNAAAMIGEDGYVSLSVDGLGAGAGMYMMAPDQLARYRQAIDSPDSGGELEQIVSTVRSLGHQCHGHEVLKTAPKGYPKDHPRIELLCAKGITVWHEWPAGSWLGTKKAKDRIVELLEAARPLNDWLARWVGPSTSEVERYSR